MEENKRKGNKGQMGEIESKYQDNRFKLNQINDLIKHKWSKHLT